MENLLKAKLNELVTILEGKDRTGLKAVIGLDGFVDEILHVVATRKNAMEYERLKTIKEYGEKIIQASGLSTNIEMVRLQEKLGGNGPILSNALAQYGVDLSYIGALGYPHLEKVFEAMAEICKVYSIANPGHTDAVEFEDGKVMVGKLESLKDVNWDNIKKIIGITKLVELINESKLLGLENWTMLPHMSDIWKGLLEEVFPLLNKSNEEKLVFFDLADPEKREKEDILEAINLIQSFSEYFKVILGLNFKEAVEIAEILGLEIIKNEDNKVDLKILVTQLAEKLQLYSMVVHPTIEASTVIKGTYYNVMGPYTPKPKLTTGAGDNFNAGFCLAQMMELTPEQSLIMGVATSGFYVRNAKSPTFNEVIEFLKLWSEDSI
ncbi:PfkB family carbohydrate kinase [Clostridium grantii]|uniref:Sugar or nucleoside kinase, ribokinase family n=1 Tax=Clostridium grantii DSM 8605 TaxID=1121316 RepID=A0A1M5S7D7_9CLOT|nr:PfkB family carbohydrate kinase [Clostridium grantii]SHH34208.1 Sugar or nucleoside kinase, ribokinase family [Clostridium grantii DSM 8605]